MHVPPSSQRLFQHGTQRFILLNRQGLCVAFRREADGRISVFDRQCDLDFRASGSALIRDGWRCLGPGLEFAWLFEQTSADPLEDDEAAGEDLGQKPEKRGKTDAHLQDPPHRSGNESF
jgi:hypothetical protein